MKKITFTIALLFVMINLVYSQVIPIDSVRVLDANWAPVLINQHVTVKGVVTTQKELGAPTVYFQVPTAGLVCYDTLIGNHVNRGDSIIVTGKVTNYSGLIEFQPVDSFRILASGITTPAPVSITPAQSRNGEQWEGRLIKINGVTDVKTTSGVHATQWTTSSSGTNYWIFVGTDSCQIRIYTSTNIAGTMIPSYPFNVVALMSQYCPSAPYNTGYQIIPRDLNDFTTQSVGPNIITIPAESNITPTSVTLSWQTLNTGDSKVKFFVSDSLGQPVVYSDSVYDASEVINHSIALNNLKPGKIYYAAITSTNASGTSVYSPKYFSTQSHTASTGKFEIYFNYSVDTSVALPNNKANGSIDFQTRIIQRIDSARYSIDLAIYSFDDLINIKQALINAMIRGVKIRIVYDSRNLQQVVSDLIAAGIKVQQRTTTSGLMHNKFFVFDGRDTSASSIPKKWIWTGSANMTYQQFYQDVENTIFIQDESLCNTYTREFEEMWGSHNDVNNSSNAKFGSAKLDNTPHIFNINGKRYECYFSASDDISSKIENMINTVNVSINFCIYAFTKYSIENKMHSKYNPPTVMVRGVFDRSTNGNITNGPVYYEMAGLGGTVWNPTAKVYLDNYSVSYLFHDKYILIDAETPSSNPCVETGSYNFSNAANFDNDENALIMYDSLVANQYYQDFVKRLVEAGGTVDVQRISSEIPSKFALNQNYPNPFNPVTNIKFQIPENGFVKIKIFDVLGRLVNVLVNKQLTSGNFEAKWDAGNYSSGIYFYSLEVNGNLKETKSMILVK
jgi:phosphatidylserine/phosphatidylglycerophosphate/cardiolipin synthase-like enzyme